MDAQLRPGQSGFVLWRDAASVGRVEALRAAVRNGDLIRVRRGVYRPRKPGEGRLYGSQVHAELVRAAAVSLRQPVFTAYSAAAVHGLPLITRWPGSVFVGSATGHGGRRSGVVHVGRLGDDEPVMVDGVLVTPIEVTLIQLARLAPLRDALAATDAALRSPRHRHEPPALTTMDRLRSVHEERRPYRGCRRVDAVLARATDQSDSPLETDSRLLFEHHGYARPELQHVLSLPEVGIVARLDFYWPDVDAAAEADGRGKYRRATVSESADVVIAEKDRENAIRRRVRAFDRWDWADRRAVTPVLNRLDAMCIPRIRPIAVL
ncbi:type IV toxin-antitoxin system AbiEi family antitoxin domain-containing protein [Agromyces aerolatus]|uniref:type IV toxin-antitoxin system AbiEi family antitoxin domain-containing protein n=1 Tax=Agromyces sp. LY-1074 TaxID=3074080 RepID=UPI002860123C|nr:MULTISPECIES: type IV toxin-antitoxin system AbiEi family antitoxin domain-containing protein [unclassified Agromyces]MDR5701403.1 type IV toxin-antitoxin system AbiEi family antitoxin domain-containing protein [Agromyces sp. LY-1074]MDR5706808.1 type IV toxin-antitoxin system AbiEi family antitoxin domain-containing protein [Agromyces sp. LY-1358]